MNHGSLFSGQGGFDLAAEMLQWKNIFHCDISQYARQLLNYYWPQAKSYENIKTTDFSVHRGRIDVLSGGFPCQPYSVAGKRKGTEDDRHLWPEMLRAIREIAPTYVVGENVRGIVSWDKGVVFDQVQADLENEGYEVVPVILPACGVGAPHIRYRVFFIGYSKHNGLYASKIRRNDQQSSFETKQNEVGESDGTDRIQSSDNSDSTSNGQAHGCEKTRRTYRSSQKGRMQQFEGKNSSISSDSSFGGTQTRKIGGVLGKSESEKPPRGSIFNDLPRNWDSWPTVSPICGGDDGLSDLVEYLTISGSKGKQLRGKKAFGKWREQSIMANGNAVVPQVALPIFQAIEEHAKLQKYESE